MDMDTDVVDLPRFRSVREAALELGMASMDHKAFCVFTKHTVNGGKSNPHFLFLKDKNASMGCYTNFVCSCGNAVRCGVPCRHFWAVMVNTTGHAAFHVGMINELWFRFTQPLRDNHQLYAHCGAAHAHIDFCRPLRHMVDTTGDSSGVTFIEGDPEAVRSRYTKMREFGQYLGVAKRAIEAVIEGNDNMLKAELMEYLQDLAHGDGGSEIRNPPKVRGKGRPAGARNRPKSSSQVVASGGAENIGTASWITQDEGRGNEVQVVSHMRHAQREPLSEIITNAEDSQAGSQQAYSHLQHYVDEHIDNSQAGMPPIPPRKRAVPTCQACGQVGHRSNNGACKVRRGIVTADAPSGLRATAEPSQAMAPLACSDWREGA